MKKYSKILYLLFTVLISIILIDCYNTLFSSSKNEIIYSVNSFSKMLSSKTDVLEVGNLANKNYTKTSDIMVYPGGKPLGIKINTKGALVIALSDIEVEGDKVQSPAALAGIAVGDSIIEINNQQIKRAEDIATYVARESGKEIKVKVLRKNEELIFHVKPIVSKNDDKFKLGLWVRDSVAGVGTLTFYHEESGKFGALGHPITDVDTATIMSVGKGEILDSNIVSVRRGTKGNPGELRGIFSDNKQIIGSIDKNTTSGVFGTGTKALICKNYSKPIKIGFKEEVKIGKAQILTTIDGTEPKLYDIVIEKLLNQTEPDGKSMVIRITDPTCLEKTGGIIQGMSGSPIIQDGKLVGAVTHVLVNKPDTGYGIYMDWMIDEVNIKR